MAGMFSNRNLSLSWKLSCDENIIMKILTAAGATSQMLQGDSGRFLLNTDTFNVKRGDYLFIPKKSIHEVWVDEGEPMRVLSIQSPEFLGDDRIPLE